MGRNEPPQTALERRSRCTPSAAILENRSILADIADALLEPGEDQQIRRSGSKSSSGRWSHWDEIGWVHYPEIGWSHSDEIRWVQSLEIPQSLVIIGEVATKIIDRYPAFADQHPDIPWRNIRGMRNRIAHGYFDINLDVVWDTVQTALPDLLRHLTAVDNK